MENLSLPEWTLSLRLFGQAKLLDGVGDGGDVERELAVELRHVAHVIHALVEAAAELGRDGLDGNAFVGDGGQNDEQLGGTLRAVGLVHGNFGDEVALALCALDLAVDFAGFFDGGEKLLRGLAKISRVISKASSDACQLNAAEQFRMALDECVDIGWLRQAGR